VGNACKFTSKGSVEVRVRRGPAEPEESSVRLCFEVSDTGPGIGPEEQAKLFEPFVQVRGRAEEGTGLGLAISRAFVPLLGGEIRLESRPGEGSTFTFDVAMSLGNPSTSIPSPLGTVVGVARGQPVYRVLVVDDQWENRELLQRLLS